MLFGCRTHSLGIQGSPYGSHGNAGPDHSLSTSNLQHQVYHLQQELMKEQSTRVAIETTNEEKLQSVLTRIQQLENDVAKLLERSEEAETQPVAPKKGRSTGATKSHPNLTVQYRSSSPEAKSFTDIV